jgi:hypothetical protein
MEYTGSILDTSIESPRKIMSTFLTEESFEDDQFNQTNRSLNLNATTIAYESNQLVSQLMSQSTHTIESINHKIFEGYSQIMQESFNQIQTFYQNKLIEKDQDLIQLNEAHFHEISGKKEELLFLETTQLDIQQKYHEMKLRLIEEKYINYSKFKSPFSLQKLFIAWKSYRSISREEKKKAKIIDYYMNLKMKTNTFHIMAFNHAIDKKTKEFEDLKFKYDTLSTEVSYSFHTIPLQLRC